MEYVNPKGKTFQELFDASVSHVLKQGKPSMNQHGSCLYNGPNGLHCGAAMFLTETERHEGLSFCNILRGKLNKDSIYFIGELQDCHDECSGFGDRFVEFYRERTKNFAEHYNLNTKVLEE